MEVKLDRRYPLHVDARQSWAVLADIRATAGCMPGAVITDQTDKGSYKGTVKSKVGPATMSFSGDINVLAIDHESRSMTMAAKGGDRSGSSASMTLDARIEDGPAQGTSVLIGTATIVVTGKLAQFGSRLLVPVSDAMLTQFAENFSRAASFVPLACVQAACSTADSGEPLARGPRTVPEAAPVVARELNALSMVWKLIRQWVSSLAGDRKAMSERN